VENASFSYFVADGIFYGPSQANEGSLVLMSQLGKGAHEELLHKTLFIAKN
jgi:hypothetical protein